MIGLGFNFLNKYLYLSFEMGKWVIGSGSTKIRPDPCNIRVYGLTGIRVRVLRDPFHTRLIGSGPGPDPTR